MRKDLEERIRKNYPSYATNSRFDATKWKECGKHSDGTKVLYKTIECPLCKVENEIFILTFHEDMGR